MGILGSSILLNTTSESSDLGVLTIFSHITNDHNYIKLDFNLRI
jgi:hypothetical protein